MKVVKSAKHYTETAIDEIKLLERVAEADPRALGARFCTAIVDHFRVHGPNGSHVCMTFEVLGENLLALIKRYKYQGIPVPLVKEIAKEMLLGLDYLNRVCKIIHTDLKPENVLMYLDNAEQLLRDALTEEPKTVEQIHTNGKRTTAVKMMASQPLTFNRADSPMDEDIAMSSPGPNGSAAAPHMNIKIADLGNACWVNHHFTEDIQTRQYRAPEVILGAKWDETADIWSLACLIFELLTGNYLFEPQTGSRFNRDDDHLAQMIELLGPMPRRLKYDAKNSRAFFDRRGELRHIHRLRFWSLEDVLVEKYNFHRMDAEEISSFLEPMLRYDNRAHARDMLFHPWIMGVPPTLDGEAEVRAEYAKHNRPWKEWERRQDGKRRKHRGHRRD
ncbi:kinase-like domain-containing protein [Syncephalastrum racemosum]|uniref:non-specific serine/threonine protein kinase n=1 Tax=Syncephalastrum racemosum TaxID=13706 RepID=A0A1X2HWD8_SYNRA|nr:kinase-like domain-containing protein [Syncephalastrum racemosum]